MSFRSERVSLINTSKIFSSTHVLHVIVMEYVDIIIYVSSKLI